MSICSEAGMENVRVCNASLKFHFLINKLASSASSASTSQKKKNVEPLRNQASCTDSGICKSNQERASEKYDVPQAMQLFHLLKLRQNKNFSLI